MDRYFVTENGVEREVTVEMFCYAEMRAGFHGPGHYSKPMSPATASFSSTKYPNTDHEETISGRTQYDPSWKRDPANLFEGVE